MRWTRPGLADALDALAGAATGGRDAPANLSVVVGGRRNGARVKHALHVQSRALIHTGSDGRLLRSVVRAAAALVDEPDPTGLRVAAFPVLAPDGSAVLVEARLGHELEKALPRIERLGYRAILASPVAVDIAAARVRVPDAARRWRLDREAFDRDFPPAPVDDDLGAVDAPVTRVVVAASADPDTPAAAVVAATGLVLHPDDRLRTGEVAQLARLLGRVEVAPYRFDDPEPLRDLITSRSSTSGRRS